MKKAALFILTLLSTLGLFNACNGLEEHYSTNPNYRLAFSADTISFDTVFTTIGSATKQLMVYNPNAEAMNIQSIMLASGGESGFRLNVDGRKGDYFDNVGILEEDSMFIFIEVTIDPNDANQPLLVEDSIVFMSNAGRQSVLLEAYGQNMHLHKGGWKITQDTTLTNDLPHLVYDSITVAPGVTLRLAEGTTLYMHDKAKLIVSGTLLSEGTLENPVTIRGDRLDFILDDILPYDRTPGQWDGIRFTDESMGNRMEHTIVRNGTTGINLEASDPTNRKIEISNCQFTNMQTNVFRASNCQALISNTEFSNSGGTVVALIGGSYQFTHCTLANFMRLVERNTSCLALANNYSDENETPRYVPLSVRFDNCIIDGSYGTGMGEIMLCEDEANPINYHFNHCVLATEAIEDEHFEEVLFVTDSTAPIYRMTGGEANRYQFDFRPDTVISLGVGKADREVTAQYPIDRLGVNRMESSDGPSIGAYEFVQEEADQ